MDESRRRFAHSLGMSSRQRFFFDVALAALFDDVFIAVLSFYTLWLYRFCSGKVGLFFAHSSRWYLVQALISIYLTINASLPTWKPVWFSPLVGDVFETRVDIDLA